MSVGHVAVAAAAWPSGAGVFSGVLPGGGGGGGGALCPLGKQGGPGTFAGRDSRGARSVIRRYSDAWFATAKRRKEGDASARYPRRKRRLMPVRYYHGTFTLQGRRLRIPVARACLPLWVRLDRDLPY